MNPSSSAFAGPRPLSELLDNALQHVDPRQPGDGYLFSGSRQDSVPRALLLDRRLTPLERNAWQVFRLLLNDDGVTTFPTYDQLRPYLTSMPCATQASHETVARALIALRLTRWLSLVRRRRDRTTGRILANLYVLHDEPLTPFEAMQLDPDYLGLVSQALTHASRSIQMVGQHVLHELAHDPLVTGRVLPTRLQVLAQHIASSGLPVTATYPQPQQDEQSEEGEDAALRISAPPSSDSEVGVKASESGPLRNPNQDRTKVLSNRIRERTVPRARELHDLRLPDRFLRLRDEQQAGALVALKQVEPGQRQTVLDEWSARCSSSSVRNPAGYLFGIIQKALRGEFKAWAVSPERKPTAPRPTSDHPASDQAPPASNLASPQTVRAHLAQLRALLGHDEVGKQ